MKSVSWVANMRIFAVFGIVALHCYAFSTSLPNDSLTGLIDWLIRNFFKPATILFFIISGYLFQAKYEDYLKKGFGRYVWKKIKKLLLPYVVLFILFQLAYILFIAPNFGRETHLVNYKLEIISFFRGIFYSNYWFLPVIFLYLIINYFIPDSAIGRWFIISILVTVFYALNIYFHFTKEVSHTTAIPGFLTFFLFGRLFYLGRIKFRVNFILLVFLFFLSAVESYLLKFDTNTIRFGNVFYSLAFFLSSLSYFQKNRFPLFFTSINYFFIYLVHAFVISYIVSPLSDLLFPFFLSGAPFLGHWVLFVLVFSISIALEKLVFTFKNPISQLFKL